MAPRQLNDVENAQNDILKNFGNDGDEDTNDEIIPGNDDDNEDDTSDDDNSSQDDNNDDNSSDEFVPVDNNNQQQQLRQPLPVDDTRNEKFSFKEDREGNFVDKDGNILVRKGKQRDLFVKIKKAWFTEQTEKNKVIHNFQETIAAAKQLLTRYNALKAEKNVAESLGLTPDESKQAAEMMALMKLDPKQAIRNILTKMHLAGTDLKDIGVTGPLDAKEVAAHLLKMQELSKPKEKSEEQKASEEVQGFLTRHPTARTHSGALAEAKRRFPHMTYDEIWFQLIDHLRRTQAATAPVARTPTRPIPHNGRRVTTTQQPNGKLSLKAVDPSQSFNQIGRDLLRDIRAAERE